MSSELCMLSEHNTKNPRYKRRPVRWVCGLWRPFLNEPRIPLARDPS
jgi:hypothetical protein